MSFRLLKRFRALFFVGLLLTAATSAFGQRLDGTLCGEVRWISLRSCPIQLPKAAACLAREDRWAGRVRA